jgi:hypothetical protein
MIKYMKEVTEWDTDYRVPQHIYIMDNKKCIGYIKEGTTEQLMFKKPSVNFNTRYRKFKEVKL